MSFIRLSLLTLAACLVWTGCPPGDRKVDEEKDSWFLLGETRQSSMDYEGAVEQFLKATYANPNSASAHKKLGILYEKELDVPDYAAAIYHYRRLLELRPDDQHADIIRDSIRACKQELAGEVGLVEIDQHTDAILNERDELLREVKGLREENRQLRDELAKRGGGGGERIQLPILDGNTGVDARARQSVSPRQEMPTPRTPDDPRPEDRVSEGRPTTHIVQQGENLYRIGLKYGFRTADEIQAANPGISPATMKPGTILRIPPKR